MDFFCRDSRCSHGAGSDKSIPPCPGFCFIILSHVAFGDTHVCGSRVSCHTMLASISNNVPRSLTLAHVSVSGWAFRRPASL